MKCYYHTEKEAVGMCVNCGKAICPECLVEVRQKNYCKNCIAQIAAPDIGGKSWLVALLLSVFVGELGVDRFYLGRIVTGILKLLTFGGLGIWWLIDVILIACNALTDAKGNRLVKREY